MPMAARRPCSSPGCASLSPCATHTKQADRQRGTAHERGYDYRWSQFSQWWLGHYPLCGMRADGRIHLEHRRSICQGDVFAECTDHIVPMSRGGEQYDEQNLQSLCIRCNSAKGNR